ncbi:MAG: hypothetical protein U0T81_00390 [Saprospiraceae bacterium]
MLDSKPRSNFSKCKYWSNRTHWEWARVPNERERNSFLKENFIAGNKTYFIFCWMMENLYNSLKGLHYIIAGTQKAYMLSK